MATPSVQAWSSRSFGTAAPSTVDTCTRPGVQPYVMPQAAQQWSTGNPGCTGQLQAAQQVEARRHLAAGVSTRRLTSAATMSMISVGSLRLPNHSLKKFLGGMALNLLAPKAALQQGAGPQIRCASGERHTSGA